VIYPDEVIRSRIHYQEHTDTITHVTDQPTEDLILNRNAELRKNPGAIRDLGKGTQTWGRQLCSIPFIMYEKALRDGYQLNATDKQFRSDELYRYLRSEEGRKCLINDELLITKRRTK